MNDLLNPAPLKGSKKKKSEANVKADFEQCAQCKRLVKDIKNVKLASKQGGFFGAIRPQKVCVHCIADHNRQIDDKEK